MKTLWLALIGLVVTTTVIPSHAEDSSALPFSVAIGGQRATYTTGKPFAKIAKPVANNAEIEVGAKADMTIINVAASSAKGEPAPGATPAVIMLQGTKKSALDKTLDGKKLSSGDYLMSVVADGQTATILLKIQ